MQGKGRKTVLGHCELRHQKTEVGRHWAKGGRLAGARKDPTWGSFRGSSIDSGEILGQGGMGKREKGPHWRQKLRRYIERNLMRDANF